MKIFDFFKSFVKCFIPKFLRKYRIRYIHWKRLHEWNNCGHPLPPPHIYKQNVIKDYQQDYGYSVFIETGTFLGHMVEAQRCFFKRIISIELDQSLFFNANRKFEKYQHITILQGDSSEVLSAVLQEIHEPAIFWLDGHYSGGITALGSKVCPVFEELDAVFKQDKPHIILIDDARLFNGLNGYPTMENLKQYIKNQSNYQVYIEHDIVRLVPPTIRWHDQIFKKTI